MPAQDPVAEWNERWQSNRPFTSNPDPKQPRSPWVYLVAAFGGTILAICSCLAIGAGLLVAIAAHNGGFDSTPQSLTYVNDTDNDLWIYECIDRCTDYESVFPLDAGDQDSFSLRWYFDNHVDWVIVIHNDERYGCIEITRWSDQTILMSAEQSCPSDIHSPESNSA